MDPEEADDLMQAALGLFPAFEAGLRAAVDALLTKDVSEEVQLMTLVMALERVHARAVAMALGSPSPPMNLGNPRSTRTSCMLHAPAARERLGTWTLEGVPQRLDGLLHLFQEDPELLAELPRFPRGDRPILGRPDEPLLLQDSQRVSDVMLRISRQLREPDDADGLVFVHNLQQGNVAAEQVQVLAQPVGQRVPSGPGRAAAAHRA